MSRMFYEKREEEERIEDKEDGIIGRINMTIHLLSGEKISYEYIPIEEEKTIEGFLAEWTRKVITEEAVLFTFKGFSYAIPSKNVDYISFEEV